MCNTGRKIRAKEKIETYFVDLLPLLDITENADEVAKQFDVWHQDQSGHLADYLHKRGCLGNLANDKISVAGKFLNTFLHQLTKYEWARPLWPQLHPPLDARVFQALAHIKSPAVDKINICIGGRTAYSISYSDYSYVQLILWEFIDELNRRLGMEFVLSSRIELNNLWL